MADSSNPVVPRSPGFASEHGAEPRPEFEAAEMYLNKHHKGAWHASLNNHMSTRPQLYGGPLVDSVTSCKTCDHVAPGSAHAAWRCNLDIPHSFAPNDGRRIIAVGYVQTTDKASEVACRQAMVMLYMSCPSQVVLRE